jgi:hypothetical protein
MAMPGTISRMVELTELAKSGEVDVEMMKTITVMTMKMKTIKSLAEPFAFRRFVK